MALLFGCPIVEVEQRVPACELPVWQVLYQQSPWDFNGLDKVLSKTAFQIVSSQAALKSGTSSSDFEFIDPFAAGTVSDDDFTQLSEAEREQYLRYATLSNPQFNALTDDQQHRYSQRMAQQLKALIGDGKTSH